MTHVKPANPELNTPQDLLQAMLTLRQEIITEAQATIDRWQPAITQDRQAFRQSVYNLALYMALRRRDLRHIQKALRPWGLSSLGRIEAQVLQNLDAVIATLAQICRIETNDIPTRPTTEDFKQGYRLLETEAEAVFGPEPAKRRVRIMVTIPSEAAYDPELVYQLVQSGMDIARINCAHDTPNEWALMVDHIRAVEATTGKRVKIAMDLGGPKSRTADILRPKKHRIQKGDTLLLTGQMPVEDKHYPVQIRCTLHEALSQVKVGEEVWFDDGKIGTVITELTERGAVLKVTNASQDGDKLAEDKGINFPDTDLHLNPLTQKDLLDLNFVVHHADIINYSFVQTPDDVRLLQQEIASRNPQTFPAIVAKIETAIAIKNLPALIVAAGALQPLGVMIARGDLAVEIGFERMAEMQEEILWICEAAHIPVIWATQVLETLAKTGRPSRAEVTDAAMAERAECVMLNKGPYITDAITILDGILTRMETHQSKKVAKLRALRSW